METSSIPFTASVLSAAAPVTAAFNLPTLPPIPDQAETVSIAAADHSDAPKPAPPIAVQAAVSDTQQAQAASAETTVSVDAPVTALGNASVPPPAIPASPIAVEIEPSVQSTPPVRTTSVAGNPVADKTHSPSEPAALEEQPPSPDSALAPTAFPKQGDLLTQNVREEKPASQAHDEVKPADPSTEPGHDKPVD
jgi:ribonuclease E